MEENYREYLHFDVWIANDIFNLIYKNDEISLKIAQDVVKARLDICQGNIYPMLSDIRNIQHVERSARQYLASEVGVTHLSAGALLVSNQFQKIAGNLFILTSKLAVPSKVFTNKQQAILWLEQFKIAKKNY